MEGASSHYMNVAGECVKVGLKPTGVLGEFDLLVMRDAMVVNPDPESAVLSQKATPSPLQSKHQALQKSIPLITAFNAIAWMSANPATSQPSM